jgi:alpha-mannosidase
MSFPFGGFKTPGQSRKGRYSGAVRDFTAEMQHDEGDPDPKDQNLPMIADPAIRDKFEKEWHNEHNTNADLYKDANLFIWALGQSHMDIAWLWRLYQILNKAKITCGKAAWHVQHIPEFKFTFSQPVMLEWLEKAEPDTFTAIKAAIETGRFELQGGCYVECDGKVPSGEAWCRQRLYGQRYYLEKFGKLATVEWLPDSFGYNNNIPQFAQKSGCVYFHTGKISGNWPPDEFPFAHFKWRSPCGEDVIVYSANAQYRPLERWKLFGHTRRICKPGELLVADYSHPDPGTDPALGEIYPHVLLIYGVGDGGHGPQSTEIHRLRHYIQQGYVKGFLNAEEYFAKYTDVADRLPIWNGAELFYNLHRGTLTTQALMKRMNRWFEWRLNSFQSAAAMLAFIRGKAMEGCHDTLTRLWKDTLLLQFHDILPGSSVPEVYDDAYDIWIENQHELMLWVQKLWNSLGISHRMEELVPPDRIPSVNWTDVSLAYFNGNAYSGLGILEIPLSSAWAERVQSEKPELGFRISFHGTDQAIPLQFLPAEEFGEPLINRPARLVGIVPNDAWGLHTGQILLPDPASTHAPGVVIEEDTNSISFFSPFTAVKFNKHTGTIDSYTDLRSSKEIFCGPSHRLQVYRDWSPNEPAWNIGSGYRECPFEDEEQQFTSIHIIERGPVRWTVETTYELPESGTVIRYRTIIYAQLPGLYFETVIDWRQHDAIAKDYFQIAGSPEKVIAEGPYTTEIYTADPSKRTHLDKQRWESCGHTWVVIPAADDSGGVVYINDSKYGFDIIKDTFGITLVRGPAYPLPAGNSYVAKERAGRLESQAPTHTDQMMHYIRYALIPFIGKWTDSPIMKYAHYFNSPPMVHINLRSEIDRLPSRGLLPVHIHAPSLELVAMKAPEGTTSANPELIVRIVETARQTVSAKIEVVRAYRIKKVTLVDLLERPTAQPDFTVEMDGDVVIAFTATWRPHEILTFKLER